MSSRRAAPAAPRATPPVAPSRLTSALRLGASAPTGAPTGDGDGGGPGDDIPGAFRSFSTVPVPATFFRPKTMACLLAQAGCIVEMLESGGSDADPNLKDSKKFTGDQMKTLRTHAEKLVRLLDHNFGDDFRLRRQGELGLPAKPGAPEGAPGGAPVDPSLVFRSLATYRPSPSPRPALTRPDPP